MKLSVFTVSTPEYGVRETAALLRELGYDGVEWRVGAPAPETKPEDYSHGGRYWTFNHSTLDLSRIDQIIPEVKSICDEYGLEICSLTTGLSPWAVEDVERVMKAANIISCRNIRIWMSNYDEKENYNTLFEKNVQQIKVLEKLAAKYNVRMNFETHMGNLIPSASAAYRLVSNFDPKYVGVIFDPDNMVYEGFENYRMGVELLGDYLAHVHVKNAIWEKGGTTPEGVEKWHANWAPMKKGYADLEKLIKVLKDVNYDGYISIEDFSNEEDTYTKLKSNIEFLRMLNK